MKYLIRATKEIQHFLEFEIEADSPQEAKEQVYLEEDNGKEIGSDCTYFEILKTHLID